MEIKEMEYFLEVCNHKSILKASKELHITQQALSKCMKKLEQSLGVELFVRNTNSISLNENSRFLYDKVKLQLNFHNIFLKELDEKFAHKNTVLKLGIAPGCLRSLGSDVLMQFISTNTNIKVELTEQYDKICEENVRNGTLDIAISTKPANLAELDYIPIKKERLFVISHNHFGFQPYETLDLSRLNNIPMVLCDENFNLNTIINTQFKEQGLTPNIIFNANEIGIMIDLVSKGKAINICAQHVTTNLDNTNIVSSPLQNPDMIWEIGIIMNPNTIKTKEILSLKTWLAQLNH